MQNFAYDVTMDTLLGPRVGELLLTAEGGVCNGVLRLLCCANPIAGSLSEDGICRFSGSLLTPVRSRPFTASGRLCGEVLELMLQFGRMTCRLRGKRKAD